MFLTFAFSKSSKKIQNGQKYTLGKTISLDIIHSFYKSSTSKCQYKTEAHGRALAEEIELDGKTNSVLHDLKATVLHSRKIIAFYGMIFSVHGSWLISPKGKGLGSVLDRFRPICQINHTSIRTYIYIT